MARAPLIGLLSDLWRDCLLLKVISKIKSPYLVIQQPVVVCWDTNKYRQTEIDIIQ